MFDANAIPRTCRCTTIRMFRLIGGKTTRLADGIDALRQEQPASLERMARAIEKVRERLQRFTVALEVGGIPYAVAGGHAVAAWVATANVGGVRNCPDLDIIVRQNDFEGANHALTTVGFVHARINGTHAFLEKPDSKIRDAVRVFIPGGRVRENDLRLVPDIADARLAPFANFWHLSLESLVGMCLSSFRLMERVHSATAHPGYTGRLIFEQRRSGRDLSLPSSAPPVIIH